MKKKPDDTEYESLNRMKSAAQRGADLVQRLMTFSRRGDAKLRPSNLGLIVTQTKGLLERTIPKMISIELQIGDELAIVNADPLQIEQILLNLAINAKDAMPQEGGKLTIATKAVTLDHEYCRVHPGTKPGPYVMLSVSDTGYGMSQETMQHIFEPFFTTKDTGKGTGLGLSIVFGIAKQHNGHINCHSAPGQGTTFEIYFPIIQAEMVEDRDSGDSVTVGGSETILLVDDEEIVSETSSEILMQVGYNVLTASCGRDAIELYRRRKDEIALIVLDLMMPEMGGIQCMRELVKINPKVKVIISSGMVSEKSEQEAIEMGAKRFVEKPHGMKKIRQVVRQVLDGD
jgi:CheY-like chemotaxis protein